MMDPHISTLYMYMYVCFFIGVMFVPLFGRVGRRAYARKCVRMRMHDHVGYRPTSKCRVNEHVNKQTEQSNNNSKKILIMISGSVRALQE